MHRDRLSDKFFRLITRPDGSARFGRLNIVLIAVVVLLAGLVPAYAATTTSSSTATTSTTANAPIVVGSTSSTTASSASSTSTTGKAATTTTAAPTTTTGAPADPNREDDYMPLAPSAARMSTMATYTPSAPNPGWPTTCDTNVAMLLDRSSSIGDPTYGGNYGNTVAVKEAANTFVRALSNKNGDTRLYVNAFATYIKPVYQWFGHTYLIIPPTDDNILHASAGKAIAAINATPFATGEPYPADYGPGGGRGRTNWQGAMADVPAGARLVIMITDGEPTWWNGANWATNDGSTQPEDVTHAVEQANALKASGARVVAVHIGNDRSGTANLQAISGPVEGEDYYYTGYAGLDATLAQIGAKACTPAVLANPAISVVKTASQDNAKAGDKVTYTFKVKNTGDVTLTNVVVADNVLGEIGRIASFAAQAETTFTKEYTVPTGKQTVKNTVLACGVYQTETVCGKDDHTLNIVSIKVEKSSDKASGVPGDKVVYSFKVTNTSAITLTDISVDDDVLGNIGTIDSLAAGASKTLTKEYTVPDGDGAIVNVVTVCAPVPGPNSPGNICDTDTHTLPRLSIGLTKTPSVDTAEVGDTVTYTYVVTNTSTVTLKNLALTDDKLGDIDLPVTTLAPGASTTGTAQYVVKATDGAPANPTGFIVNVATVAGEDADGNSVEATATAKVGVVAGTIVTTTPPTTTVQVKGEVLAYTGDGTSTLLPMAIVLLIGGAGMIAIARGRRKTATDGRA